VTSLETEYRAARADDIAGIHRLWSESLWSSAGNIHTDWTADPDPLRRAFVAADRSGVLAVVCVVPRQLRAVAGAPHPVGGIAAVATRSDARRQGHARRLLELAITAMDEAGYAWSLLFTGTPAVYASLGWRPFRLPVRDGPLAPSAGPPRRYRIRPGRLADCRPDLARIYDQYNAQRPLTAVRTDRHWRGPVGRRIEDTDLFVAEFRGEICAYGSVGWREDVVELRELGVAPDHPQAGTDLFDAIAAEANARGSTQVRAHVPYDVALAGLVRDEERVDLEGAMARPLRAGWDDLRGLATPSATFWPADGF
jgi:predicted N-acetyltransferase YhbS